MKADNFQELEGLFLLFSTPSGYISPAALLLFPAELVISKTYLAIQSS